MEGRIGKYEIQTELGRGGFGRVYRAYDPSVGRLVAIKVLSGEDDSELLARFRAEAGMTGKLQHKNIVTIFDCGDQDGAPFLVMEFLEGENLQTILRGKKSLSLLEKMRIICQIAEGLHYAHQSGVIHRDVKPANIMLLPNGTVKIMDFGIARLVDMGPSRRTRSGDLIGTTSYMSPEQFRGADADARSDIFALGLICYELLTGVHPFQAGDVSAVIYRIMSVEPMPMRDIFPDCPEPLDSLVQRALAKDCERRYSSLDDLLIDAEPILLDLRREQANQYMVDVKELITQREFDRAHSKLKQALEMDPLNREARRVKNTLQEERNRRLLEESIRKLESEAQAKLSKRAFTEALQSFESALRLMPADGRLQGLVEDTRAKVRANCEAARLLSEAKREAQNERLREARELASHALAVDPGHPEAPPLIKHLDGELEQLESARRLATGIEEGERLLENGEYDRAIEKLQTLEKAYPGSHPINDLQNRIRARQMEEFRRQRAALLEKELYKARQLQAEGEFARSLDVLDTLGSDFQGVSAIKNLRGTISEEIGAGQRAAGVTELLDSARNLLWSKRLSEAAALLEHGLQSFPADGGVQRLLETVKALHLDAARQNSLAETAAQARALRRQNRLDDAMELMKNGLKLHGNDTILSDMSRIAMLEREDRRSREQLQCFQKTASDMIASGSIPEALATVREACSIYPMEPSLELLLATAEEQLAQHNEREIVAAALNSSSDREKAGDLAGALEEIAKGLGRFPGSKNLQAAFATMKTKVQSAERERRIQKLALEIRRTMENGDWGQAAAVTSAAQREYPDQIVFDELAGQIKNGLRAAEVEKSVSGVRECLKKGDLESAAILLAQLEPVYGSEEIWRAEKRNLERRHDFPERLRKAEEWHRNGKYGEAEILLLQLLEEDPANEEATALLKLVPTKLPLQSPDPPKREAPEKARHSVDQLASTGEASRIKRRVQFGEALLFATKDRPVTRLCSRCNMTLPERARFCDTCGSAVI